MKKLIIFLIDLLGTPITKLSLFWLKLLRRIGLDRLPQVRQQLVQVGVYPVLDHYFEPLFHAGQLNRPLHFKRNLSGVQWNDSAQLDLLSKFRFQQELLNIPWNQLKPYTFCYDNNSYRAGDAESLYCMIRHYKPKRIFEIGSGNSTLMARIAIEKNREEDPGYQCQHLCIEPYEQPWLEKTGVTVYREPLEKIDLNIFRQLNKNDILFIDSSHIIRPQGDVVIEYLEILPSLESGVLVHVHDIFTPDDYPADWLFKNFRLWNEQYLLEAFLTCNQKFDVILAMNYMKKNHPEHIQSAFPVMGSKMSETFPGSFWMQSKGPGSARIRD